MRVLWLPKVLRAAGLTVHEVPGWEARGSDSFGPVRGITCHHTAGSKTSSDEGEIRTLLHGSTSAPPPIAQLYLSRTGHWHVIASGTCFHNRTGWGGPNSGYGNDALLGIEAQHSGAGEAWTDRQYDSYVRGVAALVRHEASGWDVTVARVAGHKEHQPGAKSDPTFNMDNFRTRVRAEISTWEDDVMNAAQEAKLDRVLTAIDRLPADVWNHQEVDPLSTTTPPGTGRMGGWARMAEARAQARQAALLAAIGQAGGGQVDEDAIVAGVLATLTPQAIAAAIPDEIAEQVAQSLADRLAA